VLHLYNASEDNLKRNEIARLDLGRSGRAVLCGERAARGRHRLRPPAAADRNRRAAWIDVAGGTDATGCRPTIRSLALQWYLDGTTIGGVRTRDDAEAPSRQQALQMYTRNSAFMARRRQARDARARQICDLAVLSSDYLTAPVNEIGKIRSVLTMVGGNVV